MNQVLHTQESDVLKSLHSDTNGATLYQEKTEDITVIIVKQVFGQMMKHKPHSLTGSCSADSIK